jgi:hypothetical protein
VSAPEQLTIDRGDPVLAGVAVGAESGERAARRSLRAQVARLERELSAIVADGFPHLGAGATAVASTGPSLLGLEQLERLRDQLAGRVQELSRRAQQRAEHELRAQELLERMKLEPGRYKFVRLPVTDLGQRGCGVWEVRPRFGLIGMLAGWWELKLSSGCPLPRGSREQRDPASQILQAVVSGCLSRCRGGGADHEPACHVRPRSTAASIAASVWRWRSVIEPTVFFSDIGSWARNRRQRVCPQRRWAISRSATAMLCVSGGH